MDRCAIVLDVGKTHAKVSAWNRQGRLLDRRERANETPCGGAYRALDVEGIEAWMLDALAEWAGHADIGAIVPVAHGAGAALVYADRLFAAPMDYECGIPDPERRTYDAGRDGFLHTGSPRLPLGLNLGAQLHFLESRTHPWPPGLTILTWPQYWAWRLCGVMSTEVTSLGCHSDLWRPFDHAPSELARRRGWAARLAPLRRASERLGPISTAVSQRTGLPPDCQVLCGIHDSNAALLAARGHGELAGADATVLSTGTWFVAMRSLAQGGTFDIGALPEARDGLVNVDPDGRAVPSSRFMGGREFERLGVAHVSSEVPDAKEDPADRVPRLIESGLFVLPSFAAGTGPYPTACGHWNREPADPLDRRAAAELYLATMADVSLDLIGSQDRLLVEGRFATASTFVRALAALRPTQRVLVSDAQHDVAYGALRLVDPGLEPTASLSPVTPLGSDLAAYARRWRTLAAREAS